MRIKQSDIHFQVDGKQCYFSVWHDLPDTPGLRIEDAVDNWFARIENPDDITAQNLCNYINNKDIGHNAFPFDPRKTIRK